MKNISNIRDCYGCGVCVISCPLQIISIELDKDGFYQPKIMESNRCTHCGLCLSVCAYSHNKLALENVDEINGYAAWSNNNAIRNGCSSGGISFELGKHLLTQGFKACGVKYNTEQCRAEHFLTNNEMDYKESIGSKYIQSYTLNAFTAFKKEEKYFVTGTPCQIDSLRRYIRLKRIEDNFILMDFFCHGVPSMLMWKKYIKSVENKIGEISAISWRNKETGWHDSYVINALSKYSTQRWNSRMSKGDWFYKMFLSDICLGKSCYTHCKYKGEMSSADIRVGDLWGNKFKDNNEGVSGVLVFTEAGKSVLKQLKDCVLVPQAMDAVLEGQMRVSPKLPRFRKMLIKQFRGKKSIATIQNYYIVYKIINKLYKIIKK